MQQLRAENARLKAQQLRNEQRIVELQGHLRFLHNIPVSLEPNPQPANV